MHRLLNAIRIYFRTQLTWSTSWAHAGDNPSYQVVSRDGFEFVEPRPFR